jgi:membrane protein DedA with SNARE-associated domain
MITPLLSATNIFNSIIIFIWTFFSSFGLYGGGVLLISSGAFANSLRDLIIIILFGGVAAILGDIAAYELARKFSPHFTRLLSKFKFFRKGEVKARELLEGSQFLWVFFTRFALVALGPVVTYISGFEKMKRKKYLAAVISGEIIYAILFPTLGYVFKETWNDLNNIITDFVVLAILIVVAAYLIRIVVRDTKWMKKSAKYTKS